MHITYQYLSRSNETCGQKKLPLSENHSALETSPRGCRRRHPIILCAAQNLGHIVKQPSGQTTRGLLILSSCWSKRQRGRIDAVPTDKAASRSHMSRLILPPPTHAIISEKYHKKSTRKGNLWMILTTAGAILASTRYW